MLLAAEEIFGPYLWDRFDFLVMPPSLPLRRHGEPAPDLPDAHAAGGRPLAGQRAGPRAGPQLDRQPGHQRHHGRLLAQRGLHRVGRAAHPREAGGHRGPLPVGGHRAQGPAGCPGPVRDGLAVHPAEDRQLGLGSRRVLLHGALREGLPAGGADGADRRPRQVRRLRQEVHRDVQLHLHHHRPVRGLPGRRAARPGREGGGRRLDPRRGAARQRAVVHVEAPGGAAGAGQGLERRAAPGPGRGQGLERHRLADLPAGPAPGHRPGGLRLAGQELPAQQRRQQRDPLQLAGPGRGQRLRTGLRQGGRVRGARWGA